jgi:hypothetical protein
MVIAVAGGGDQQGAFADVEWRLSYHDLPDRWEGYPRDTSLNMGRLGGRVRDDGSLRLQVLELLEISSLPPRDKYFRSWSWQTSVGLERQYTEGQDELAAQGQGGFGVTYAAPAEGRVFLLAQGRIEFNRGMDRQLDMAVGGRFGYLRQHPRGSTLAQVQRLRFSAGRDRTLLTLEHNLPLTTNRALRLGLRRSIDDSDASNEASLAYRIYF